MERMESRGARPARALLAPLTISVALPLAVYYALRAQGIAQWQALLLSSAIPAAHALVTALVRRRAEVFDLLIVALLAVSAVTSLISGSPRVLLLKDAGLPAVLGVWILGTLFAARPFAFQFGRRLRDPAAEEEAERVWDGMPEFRAALRGLTMLWGGVELLDAALSTVEALSLPVDVVPVLGRFQSIALIALLVVVTIRRSRGFQTRHGVGLFGVRPAGAPAAEEIPGRAGA